MSKGKLIVIEGACDGIGKSTQLNMLVDHLLKDGLEVSFWHFPSYSTYHGVPVEKFLKGVYGLPNNLSPYFVNGLYAMDRAIAWHEKLEKLYNKGNIILLDRYTTSSLIYQSAYIEDYDSKAKFIDYVCDFEYNKLGIKKPDNVIFLDAPFHLIMKLKNDRLENDGVDNDVYERDKELMFKVYVSSQYVSTYLSFDKINCVNGYNFKTKEEIHEEIYNKVRVRK